MIPAIYQNIKKQRTQWLAWEKERDERYQIPDGVRILRDHPLPDTSEETVDLYLPAGSPENPATQYPVLINIHGGGMVMGTKHQNLGICAEFASMGFLVIGIEYPLVPEATVSEQLNSISRTLDLVEMLLPDYHGDPERVFLSGDSAGAFLSLYTAAISGSEEIAEAFAVAPTHLAIRALGLSSGLYYSTRVDKNGIFILLNDFYGKGWKKKAFAPYLNPEHQKILSVLPPCFLSTSAGDFLKDHTLKFEKALAAASVPHTLVFKEDKVEHAFNALYPEWDESRDVNRRMADYLLSL